jgi:multiple antibiotic resistance protein
MEVLREAAAFFLLAFPGLVSIVNPLGGAFIFLSATRRLTVEMREPLARWVAIHSFVLLSASVYVGAYVLGFFGISMPVLRAAGGIVIAMAAWKMLNAEDDAKLSVDIGRLEPGSASRLAFYPLTMPLTTGPGSMSVAIALGTSRQPGARHLLPFLIGSLVTTLLLCLLIYACYRHSDRIAKVAGPTGTAIAMRLSAFLLFCIGIQVLWTGVAELLASVRVTP